MLSPAQLTQLKTELNSDPRGYGYAPLLANGNDTGLAEALNMPRAGAAGTGAAITLRRARVDPQTLIEAIDTRDFSSNPNPLAVGWFESATQVQLLRLLDDAGNDTRVLSNFKRLVTNTNGSQTRLNAASNYFASRAEELFGTGVTISDSEIAAAKAA